MNKISDSIYYIGCDDHELDLFEGHFEIPLGMSYNSYVVRGEKTAVMDTMDRNCTAQWMEKLRGVLGDSAPDYLVIHHMEPDHSASVEEFMRTYPGVTVVGSAKTLAMISQFFPELSIEKRLEVKEGDVLDLGGHRLSFIAAPMVHWPEVMFSYDESEKILFSADAFGKFGALDAGDEDWASEARRYYFGIVGKYGMQVQNVLKKAAKLDIRAICPLHGPVLSEDTGYYIGLYDTWSSYRPEESGVALMYSSVYGHTKEAAQLLAAELEKRGVRVVTSDLARSDIYRCVADAFRFDRLVLATTTYNAGIFPCMREFIDMLVERGYRNRTIAFMENGSWAPVAAKCMKAELESLKDIAFAENIVTVVSALSDASRAQIALLADELAQSRG